MEALFQIILDLFESMGLVLPSTAISAVLLYLGSATGFVLFLLYILTVIVYFIPTILAILRHGHIIIVLLLNVFIGWSGVGWVVALAVGLIPKNK